jgi:hypothetical protein
MSLLRWALFDLARIHRICMAILSADAAQCYDSMSHSAISLGTQQWGVPVEVVVTMLLTIRLMRFHLRMAYGDSQDSYGGNLLDLMFQGICQGNGGGPACWVAISAVLVSLLRLHGSMASFHLVLSLATLTLVGLIFVDDTDLLYMSNDPLSNIQEVVDCIQRGLLLWRDGLHSTGGRLAPDKCSWCLIAFHKQGPNWCFHTSESQPASLSIPSPQAPLLTIHRLEPLEAIMVLGVEQSVDEAKLSNGKTLAGHSLPRHMIWTAFKTTIWPFL